MASNLLPLYTGFRASECTDRFSLLAIVESLRCNQSVTLQQLEAITEPLQGNESLEMAHAQTSHLRLGLNVISWGRFCEHVDVIMIEVLWSHG